MLLAVRLLSGKLTLESLQSTDNLLTCRWAWSCGCFTQWLTGRPGTAAGASCLGAAALRLASRRAPVVIAPWHLVRDDKDQQPPQSRNVDINDAETQSYDAA